MGWKRDEVVSPPQPTGTSPSSTPEAAATRSDTSRQQARDMVNIGKSVIIKGELSGSEDLTIEGQVDGKIELKQNVLTIGPNGRIKAEIFAKAIVVQGEVHGNITATERVDIRDNGSVDGDVSAPRVAIADGAHFRGAIDMQRQAQGQGQGAKPATESKPAAPATAAAGPVSVAR